MPDFPVAAWRFFPLFFFFFSFFLHPLSTFHTNLYFITSSTIHSQSYTKNKNQYPLQNGFSISSPRKSSSFSRETDIIDPSRTSSITHISSPPPSESPFGPLNFSSALRNSSSSTENLLPFDLTSFTTDNHQQSWLPTPPPHQPLAQNLNSNSSDNNNSSSNASSHQEDFVLYPTTRPQPRLRDSRATVPSSTAPRPASYHPFLVRSQYQSRRHSLNLHQYLQQQQLSGSPVQVPSVTRPVSQSTGYPLSSSLRSSPSSRKHLQRVHAASVPSNSPNPNRPPVPLFSNNNTNGTIYYNQKQQQELQNYHRRIMSTPNIAQDMPDLFDLPPSHFGDDFDLTAAESTMFSPHLLTTGLMTAKDSMAGVPSGTISPKDLMMDASAPPSTSFTDLSTPSFESPGYFSQDTSPMFPTELELGPGHEEWESLFPSQEGFSVGFDVAALDMAVALAQPKAQPTVEVVPPSPVVRDSVSPAPSSPATGKGVTKHSTVAGVNARQRKPLPPIKYDVADPVALKRARNTEAARKSRARKLERQDVMERRIAELEKSLEEAQQREQYWKALAQNRA